MFILRQIYVCSDELFLWPRDLSSSATASLWASSKAASRVSGFFKWLLAEKTKSNHWKGFTQWLFTKKITHFRVD